LKRLELTAAEAEATVVLGQFLHSFELVGGDFSSQKLSAVAPGDPEVRVPPGTLGAPACGLSATGMDVADSSPQDRRSMRQPLHQFTMATEETLQPFLGVRG